MSSVVTTRPSAPPPAPATPQPLSSYVQAYWRRVRGGDLGSLPAVLGIVVLVTGFSLYRPVFFTPGNFANLLPQAAGGVVIAMGLVFVLLVGEIDLSAGFTSGTCAALMTILLGEHNVAWYVAIPIAIVTGTVIGMILGTLVAKVGIPSFVVTLAAFLALQGVLLWLVKEGQYIPINDTTVLALANRNMPVWLGWLFLAVCVLLYAAVQIVRTIRRTRRGLTRDPLSLVAIRIGALGLFGAVGVYVLSLNRSLVPSGNLRGVPIVVPIVVVLLVLLTFVLKRTRYGLHLYAVGGNAEAARRAGIPVDRVRISAFMVCSTLAAIGGILLASRANSVDGRTGGANLLLYAVGAAVIGGTSLFGGRGRVLDAVLGGIVVYIIDNGMGLLGDNLGKSWVRFVVTGLVLLGAAAVDAIARRRSQAAGLR
jgi:D-xylose transport system permease protein